MKRLLTIFILLSLINILLAQVKSPSSNLTAMSINGYQYPASSFSNLFWMSLASESMFINELQKFDYPDFETTKNDCPFVNSGYSLPNAKYSIVKCEQGSVKVYWIMNNGRRDRNHPAALLLKDLANYEFKMGDLFTRTFRIRYLKWYVKITIYKDLSQEIIDIKTSLNPID